MKTEKNRVGLINRAKCFYPFSWQYVINWNPLPLQLQMDKLPSRHAITELMSWISLMEDIIQEDEENIKNVVGHKAIQDYLQKYKVIKWGWLANTLNLFCQIQRTN